MSNENGNGEVKKLVALRHDYKDEVVQLEEDLKAKFEQELDAGKKDLKDKYLEKVVDWFYSNGFNGNGHAMTDVPPPREPEPAASPEVEGTPALSITVTPPTQTQTSAGDLQPTGSVAPVRYCDDCGKLARPDANYCSYCAAPLREPTIRIAGHMRPLPRDRERMVRIARETAYAPRADDPDRRVNDWARTRHR